MKKILKSFTFYCCLLSLLIIYLNIIGKDSKGIIMIGLNPILYLLGDVVVIRDFLNSGPSLLYSWGYSVYWHIAHFLTFFLFGLILDYVKYILSRKISD